MPKESNVFVNIGDHRKTIEDLIKSQGLCKADVPALRAAAKRFVHLTPDEAALPADEQARIRAARRSESQRVLDKINEIAPTLRPRLTITDVVCEALVAYLPQADYHPDVATTFKDLTPDPSRLAR